TVSSFLLARITNSILWSITVSLFQGIYVLLPENHITSETVRDVLITNCQISHDTVHLCGRPGVVRWIFRPLNRTSHLTENLRRSPAVKTAMQTHRPVCSISAWPGSTCGSCHNGSCAGVEYDGSCASWSAKGEVCSAGARAPPSGFTIRDVPACDL